MQTPILNSFWQGTVKKGVVILAGLLTALPVCAQILEDIEVRTQNSAAELRLLFSMPVRYVKHFPPEKGQLIKLYLQTLGLEGEPEVEYQEYKRVPAMSPSFKVNYSTAQHCLAMSGRLCLDIQFEKPVRFRIRQGDDGRSILMLVLPDTQISEPAPRGR